MISGKVILDPEEEQESLGEVLDLRKSNVGSSAPGKGKLCSWCGKRNVSFPNGLISSNWTYCSQRCYEKFRRAVFKKRSACLWCSNLSGRGNGGGVKISTDLTLQSTLDESKFCSECCLTQFKLQLFCEETTSHLKQIQEEPEPGERCDLITPALWLRKDTAPPCPSNVTNIDERSSTLPGDRSPVDLQMGGRDPQSRPPIVTTQLNYRVKKEKSSPGIEPPPLPKPERKRKFSQPASLPSPSAHYHDNVKVTQCRQLYSKTSQKLTRRGDTEVIPKGTGPSRNSIASPSQSIQISFFPIPFPFLFPIILRPSPLRTIDSIEDLD